MSTDSPAAPEPMFSSAHREALARGAEAWHEFRREQQSFFTANLCGTDLRGLNLSGVDLSRANLREADLREVSLIGTDLSGADLSGADLSGVDLTRSILSSTTQLSRTNLTGADLRRLDIPAAKEAQMVLANLSNADLVHGDLSQADLAGADLSNAKARHVTMVSASLVSAVLRDADLQSARLTGADLRDAALARANLSGADLARADLRNAHLRRVSLNGAVLHGASLAGAKFELVDLRGADLTDADIDRNAISRIRYNKSTTWPQTIRPPRMTPWRRVASWRIGHSGDRADAVFIALSALWTVLVVVVALSNSLSAHEATSLQERAEEASDSLVSAASLAADLERDILAQRVELDRVLDDLQRNENLTSLSEEQVDAVLSELTNQNRSSQAFNVLLMVSGAFLSVVLGWALNSFTARKRKRRAGSASS